MTMHTYIPRLHSTIQHLLTNATNAVKKTHGRNMTQKIFVSSAV